MTTVTSKPRRRAAKYRRISDDREGRELGVQRQDEDLDRLGERRNLDFVADFVDNDISATKRSQRKRPDYERMIAAARAGEFEVIAACTTGRLTRRPREFEDLIDLAEDHGIAFMYDKSPEFDLTTSAGKRMARWLAAQDAGEADDISERVRRKVVERAQAGLISGGGTRPFGYEDDRKTIRPDEAVLIRQVAQRVLAGESLKGQVREWNERGITTPAGGVWASQTLRRMLMSARISGRREHKGIIVAKAVWPGIIEPSESDRLRELLSDPRRMTYDGDSARKYLLTGFLWCGIAGCGLKLIARPQADRQRSYVCAIPGRSHLRIHAESLELYVKEAALDYLDEFVHLAAAVRTQDVDTRDVDLWSELRNYQTRLERVRDAFYVHDRLPEAEFNRLSSELETLIQRTKDDLAKVRRDTRLRDLPSGGAMARAAWDERSFTWRRTLLSTLVERVEIGQGVRGRNKFDPDRIAIKWRKP
ncbi:recombinase family protein [Micromonospora sp. C72]|uniref:recombinase family protein n=1 Tax=Micromonospora sp. C72 TaxID=2824880 RepID=UPI001B36C97E|nr:recombinase family protein [Micromonospora sp. C72]MBQ1042376.1 recombinase family protein [Micromonospora sp. C72]